MQKQQPVILTIAGSDCSGGAGIQADIKSISANGAYAASVITALTAQNTVGVQAIEHIRPAFVHEQLLSVFSDLPVAAVKIGMIPNADIAEIITTCLKVYKPNYVILDPVMVAASGDRLVTNETLNIMKRLLFPLASMLTPNIAEAVVLSGIQVYNIETMRKSAQLIGDTYQTRVLVKGGHLCGNKCVDVLYSPKDKCLNMFTSKEIKTKNTHGTGCTLASAIASQLGHGKDLISSIQTAKHYLTGAISAGQDWQLGRGCGPVWHFYSQV